MIFGTQFCNDKNLSTVNEIKSLNLEVTKKPITYTRVSKPMVYKKSMHDRCKQGSCQKKNSTSLRRGQKFPIRDYFNSSIDIKFQISKCVAERKAVEKKIFCLVLNGKKILLAQPKLELLSMGHKIVNSYTLIARCISRAFPFNCLVFFISSKNKKLQFILFQFFFLSLNEIH